MNTPSRLSSPGDITAPPILSSSEIDDIINQLLTEAIRSGGTDKALLAKLSIKFNTALIQESYSERELISNIDEVFNAFIEFSLRRFQKLVEKGSDDDAREFIEFVNFLLKLLKIKKVYNNIPRQDFTRFSKNEDHTQILQLTLPRGEDLGERPLTHGGSCHNWSIIFKQYFDQLGIPSSIIFCVPFSNHSFTLLRLKGKYYIFDPILRIGDSYLFEVSADSGDQNNENVLRKIMVGMGKIGDVKAITTDKNTIELTVECEEQSRTGPYGRVSTLKSYANISDFSADLDEREIDYIILGYRLEDERGFKIDFNREGESITFDFFLGTDDKEDKSNAEIHAKINPKTFLLRFLADFLGRRINGNILEQILRHYGLNIDGKENNLFQLQSQLMSEEEISRLAEWIGESTNYQLFEAFFSQLQSNPLGSSLYGKKNTELLAHFKKATSLMHKRSVVKFLLLGALVPDVNSIEHKKGTYSRNKILSGDDTVGGDVAKILAVAE